MSDYVEVSRYSEISDGGIEAARSSDRRAMEVMEEEDELTVNGVSHDGCCKEEDNVEQHFVFNRGMYFGR